MRILFISPIYSDKVGGRERYLYKISAELSKDCEVKAAARFDTPVDFITSTAKFITNTGNKEYSNNNVKVHVLGINLFEKIILSPAFKLHFNPKTRGIAKWLHNKIWVKKIIELVKWADIVEYHGTGLGLLGFSALKTCNLTGKPFVILPHCHPGSWGDGEIDIQLYKSAAGVIVKSEVEKQFMISKGVPADKIKVIYSAPIVENRYDAGYFRKKYNVCGDMVLFVGRRTRGKGYFSLVEAVEKVWQSCPETYFVFIGDGEVVHKFKDKRIIELGWRDGFEKSSAYATCDVFCMPSYEEAFGIAYAEAWSFGKPVVGGNIPALREIISEGKDGLLVMQNPEEIANALVKLLKDKELRKTFGINGKRKLKEKFNWDKVVKDTKNFYEKIIKM